MRMIDRAFEHDGGAPCQQRRIYHVTVTDDPADIRRGPPDVVWLESEAPPPHADDVDLVSAMSVNRKFWRRRRARGGQNERRFVRLQFHELRSLPHRPTKELVP